MVFGVFDGVHEGHRYFLREAKKLGDTLIVVVARDENVKALKGKEPRMKLEERIKAIEAENLASEIVPGDDSAGTWNILGKYEPDVVALGYDQKALRGSIEARLGEFYPQPELAIIGSFEPEKYHSSLLGS
jgi:FAD synthetase